MKPKTRFRPYSHSRCTGLVIVNLDVFQRRTRALSFYLQALEDGFLSTPLASEAGLRTWRLLAVRNLGLSEVAFEERVIVNINGVDALDVDARIRISSRVDFHQALNRIRGALVFDMLLHITRIT